MNTGHDFNNFNSPTISLDPIAFMIMRKWEENSVINLRNFHKSEWR
jgi:hypothetical protein